MSAAGNMAATTDIPEGKLERKIQKLRRWSSSSFKRPSKKTKTYSLCSPTEPPEETRVLRTPDRRRLKPIVASVFGQVGPGRRCSRGGAVGFWEFDLWSH
ncbi:hypothetical protein DPEC_G00182030 [Dallia pectoralis]|uniref:Uncharacterized protein n=1 Tax=Dallia pectoralis TaxID=75939 RepID=A0ACC2GAM1_DALPE|nr:hypothetical protein DPEC_G00182030 [Dallia pectoralis]